MDIKKIQDADVWSKKVIVRVDFNVSIGDDDDAKSTYKINAAKNTVDHLFEQGAKCVALLTHFGRPGGKPAEEFSLKHLADDVSRVLERDVIFVSECIGDEVINAVENCESGTVILLENVRFYEEEKKDNERFAASLCAPFDLYVNDAFAVCHRKHASVHAITNCVPSFAGLWVQKEVESLEYVKNKPKHPAVAIIGGSKIDTKIPMIEEFAQKYETVLVGGKTAVEARDQKIKLDDNVILPIDFEYKYYDIGPKTIERFCEVIDRAATIVWNGPMGLIEEEQYKKGTLSLIKAIAKSDAFSLIGGGESVQMIEESGFIDDISFVSTGGGAMLAYLGGEDMPGLSMLLCRNGKCE